jgi:leucyl aminopeptidase
MSMVADREAPPRRAVAVPAGFDPVPSIERVRAIDVSVVDDIPGDAEAVAIPVDASGAGTEGLDVGAAALAAVGFEGKPGQTHAIAGGDGPVRVAVGVGDAGSVDAAAIRDAAAAFALAARRQARLAVRIPRQAGVDPGTTAQVIVEGILLARYAYEPLRSSPSGTAVASIALVADSADREHVAEGARRGKALASATMLARDLANTPPAHLTAPRFGEVATAIARDRGLEVEVYEQARLQELGCGGILGVNGGSADEARLIKLTYRPRGGAAAGAAPRLALVAKGIMYDSGGISLKPSDAVHATMKNDMSGAGAVLAAMSVLGELGGRTEVTGYLSCTDNVPSGTALKLGDVITIHGGTTVEVLNTDAEGRLVMADALVMAAEEKPDAIVDIATLTGAAMRALGTLIAGVIGNDQGLVDQVRAASDRTDEQTWQLPLERRYRRELNSEIADITNMGGPNAGATTAALFLEEFTDGRPWAHVDIAGTAQTEVVESWRVKGCSGFGARLLTELALEFRAPS